MRLLRALTPLQVVVCTGLLLAALTVQGGTEGTFTDKCKFHMGYNVEQQGYIEGTTDRPEDEIVTLDFMTEFDPGFSGNLSTAVIKFHYDPTKLTLVGAIPADNWNGVGITDTTLRLYPEGQFTQAVYTITKGTSSIPMDIYWNLVAQFRFKLTCQSTYNDNVVTVEKNTGGTLVTSGINYYYVEADSRITNGIISPNEYGWFLRLVNTNEGGTLDLEGVLGEDINIPIYAWSNFRVGDVDMYITFDNTRLQWSNGNVVWLDPSFVSYSASLTQPGLLHIHLTTNEATYERHEFDESVQGDKALELKFKVLGTWEGSSTTLAFQGTPSLVIAQFDGTCSSAQFDYSWAEPGVVSIANYVAAFSTVFTDGATLGLHDDQATMLVKLASNFPAGRGINRIIANMKLDANLEANSDYLGPDFQMYTHATATGQEVSLRLESNSVYGDVAEPQDMIAFSFHKKSTFVAPTAYENRFYPITYQTLFNSIPSVSAGVIDSTGRVTTTNSAGTLTWDNPQIEYLMGEYYCPSVGGGSGTIAQSYYMRSSFNLEDFRVKIAVAGAHNIYDVALEPGVEIESIDATSYKWVILRSNALWTAQAAGDTRVKFATITYCYWGAHAVGLIPLALSQPGPGRPGHWETRASTVSFVFAADSGYYMNDISAADQYEVAIGGTVVSHWWVDPPLPQYDLATGPGGLPTEYALMQNYPNPFNPTTEFMYALPEGAYVEIAVYNITGQKVTTLVEGWREAGFHNESWDASDMASGVYIYRLQTDKFSESKKMILLK